MYTVWPDAIAKLHAQQRKDEKMCDTVSMQISQEIKNDLDLRRELQIEIEKGCNSTENFCKSWPI